MKIFRFIADFADRVNGIVGYATSWVTTLLVGVVCFDVFTRYVLKSSSVAVQELEWHLFALIFLLGAAYTLKLDNHVRVDVFYTRLQPKTKAVINLVGSIVFLIPFSILVIKTSLPFAVNAYNFKEVSPDPGGLPYRWVLKSMITVGFSLLLLQAFALVSRSVLIIAGEEDNNG